MKPAKWPVDKISIVLIAIGFLYIFGNLRSGKYFWKEIVLSDALGYYAYLPAVFIYHDLHFGFKEGIERKYEEPSYYTQQLKEGKINKYYAGTALAEMPFFLIAHAYARLAGFDADGYSAPYMYAVALAAIFYMLAGLVFIRKILRLHGHNQTTIAIVLWVCAFGTHLFVYTLVEPGMSHVFSFAFVSAFIYYALRWMKGYEFKYLLLLAVALGMVVLIRPVNAMVVLAIPFLAGSFNKLKEIAKYGVAHLKKSALAIAVVPALFFIQLVFYKVQTGHFIVYSYQQEGFRFFDLNILNFLFSYKKGFFLYTPVLLVALLGTIVFFKQSLFKGLSFMLFFMLVVYVLSSWWCWWYGGSFSARPMVEFIPFLIMPLAALISSSNKVAKSALITVLVLLVALNQVQIYQYRYAIVHWSDMDKQMYWDRFLVLPK